ncbi:MAG: DUF6580 family putative transport protein [Saprospiraceae bacterium]|nr:DUF6580 family putative transport protein [Saprospiraceae bacterium]
MKLRENFALVVILIVFAAMTRLIPHWPNFTAVGAMALFGGAYLSRKFAFLIPLIALFVSDLVLNNLMYAPLHPESVEGFQIFYLDSLWIYGAFVLIVLLGQTLLKRRSIPRLAGATVLTSVSFFLITNFGVWASSVMYPKTWAGLIACFEAGIPFFWNTLAGDAFFVTVLFGGYALIAARQQAAAQKQEAG